MKLNKVFSKNIFLSFLPYLLSALSMIIGFLSSYFLARTLGAEIYGEIRYVISLFTTFSSVLLFGLSNFLIKESKNPTKKETILNYSFSFLFIVFIFLSPVIFKLLKDYFHIENHIYIISVLFASISISIISIYGFFNQGIGKYHITQLVTNIIPRLVMLIITILFYFLLNYSWFASNYVLIYSIVYGTLALIILILKFRSFKLGFEAKDYLSLTFFFGTTLTYSITSELTNIIQGTFYNDTSVLGIIGVSAQILSLLTIFTTVVSSITMPLFSDCKRKGDKKGILEVYRLNLRVTFYIAVPFYLFLVTQGDKFLLFFGESYLAHPMIIVFCTIGSAINVLTGQTGSILLMTGKEKIELLNGGINIITYVFFAVLFKNNPIYGLTIANMLSAIVVNLVKVVEVSIIYKECPINFKSFLSFLIVASMDFVFIFFLKYINIWIVWLIVGIVVGIISIVLNFVVSLYRKDFIHLISLRKRFEE